MRTRIDRFIEDALGDFTKWYVDSDWLGKERDCVNIFALSFLANKVQKGAAIGSLSQIRIEGAVPQPKEYMRAAANKDLVIWPEPLDTTWDATWTATHVPRVVMEWKTNRTGEAREDFDKHDSLWLTRFTEQFPGTFGYVVAVHHSLESRSVSWSKISRGVIKERNRRS